MITGACTVSRGVAYFGLARTHNATLSIDTSDVCAPSVTPPLRTNTKQHGRRNRSPVEAAVDDDRCVDKGEGREARREGRARSRNVAYAPSERKYR